MPQDKSKKVPKSHSQSLIQLINQDKVISPTKGQVKVGKKKK